jgi:hypothetical protein
MRPLHSHFCVKPSFGLAVFANWCIKGIVTLDEYFFDGPHNQINTFRMSADGFTIFGCLYGEKITNKVYACFFEITY